MVHVREVDGEPVRFGHSGALWHNAYLLYDTGTGSLWHNYFGVCLSGPLRGKALRRLPTAFLPYGAWKAEHPDTLVLRKPDPAPGTPDLTADGYANRNAALRFGYGLEVGRAPRFYPFDAFPARGLVEEDRDGVPVAVVRDPAAATAYAYDRRIGGAPVSLDVDTGADGRPLLRERGGRRAWSLRTGSPVAGTGAEAPLTRLPGSVWEDAAWTLQHPRGTVRRPGGER